MCDMKREASLKSLTGSEKMPYNWDKLARLLKMTAAAKNKNTHLGMMFDFFQRATRYAGQSFGGKPHDRK